MAISPYVIKSETDTKDVKAFLDDPKPLQPVPLAEVGQAEAFLDLSLRARAAKEPELPELPPAVKIAVNKHLLEVLEILQNGRFEFAFRTAKEAVAYLKVSRELAADKAAWEAGKFDGQFGLPARGVKLTAESRHIAGERAERVGIEGIAQRHRRTGRLLETRCDFGFLGALGQQGKGRTRIGCASFGLWIFLIFHRQGNAPCPGRDREAAIDLDRTLCSKLAVYF